jgi:molybdopterin molybdotransferase
MISVKAAKDLILSHSLNLETATLPIIEAVGHILAEDVLADRDSPPFNRVTMDGVALQASRLNSQKSFKIAGIQAAGQAQLTLEHTDQCLEVMTGAVLPKHTDCVIPYEWIQIENQTAIIEPEGEVFPDLNVHQKGSDALKGDILIGKGKKITPGAVGVMAAVGISRVKVTLPPKVVVCATGDELIPIEEKPLPHQIRNSNSPMLVAALRALGVKAESVHIPDEKEAMKRELGKLLGNYKVLMFSGAVSKGKFDFLPEALEELGMTKKIHGVAQKPGKPFLFGQVNEALVFGFPGNPASTLVCFHTYFIPLLYQALGMNPTIATAKLTTELNFKKPLTLHQLVTLSLVEGELLATPVQHSGSGDLIHLSIADGFLSLPEDQQRYGKNEVYPLAYFNK